MFINYISIADSRCVQFHYAAVLSSNILYFILSVGEYCFMFQAEIAFKYAHYWTRVQTSFN